MRHFSSVTPVTRVTPDSLLYSLFSIFSMHKKVTRDRRDRRDSLRNDPVPSNRDAPHGSARRSPSAMGGA
jgi:hypothetical protein